MWLESDRVSGRASRLASHRVERIFAQWPAVEGSPTRRLVTPPLTADILESITRATLIDTICPEVFGMGVDEREIDRTELYVADEAFFCGSGYEITPITSIDRFPLGDGQVGPITRRLSHAYLEIVRGLDERYSQWRTPVYRAVTV